ncbi:hypothetical protein EDB84DRAFT_1101137 [Lactarius hengduanensis]|nr:hypothetical protein EDB84DRAFT_1101137 [Lactarius hengduanensis]
MAHASGECHRQTATLTINILPDDIFLEIFAFCVRDPSKHPIVRMGEWRSLVHVSRRWRHIIYASPRYLDLHLCCSNWTNASARKILGFWPAFPVAISYHLPVDEDDVIVALEHRDRVRSITLKIQSSQFEKIVVAMQEPFPVLTHLVLYPRVAKVQPEDVRPPTQILSGGFLGGSAPCLQQVHLSGIPFLEFPTFLLSSRDLVSLRLDLPPRCMSPEAMAAGLSVLSRLETLCVNIQRLDFTTERRRPLDPPRWAVLPVLTKFEFRGCSEYCEDLMAQIDAPLLNDDVRIYWD